MAVPRPEMIAGLLLAAFAHGASEEPLVGLSLADALEGAAQARLAELGLTADSDHDARERALSALARSAASAPIDQLPANARAAALLAPIASSAARAGALALPMPRRGYRPAPGLREQLRRLAAPEVRATRAEQEVARVGARAWPA